jgi:dTDP-4-amino-4,6-dideoxygalactose transaminase
MAIRHFDHAAHYARDREAIDAAIRRVLEAGQPIMGPEVGQFERAFAELCGVRHAVGVMSGSAALVLALEALRLGPGDEVITVANSDIPTSQAITHAGARVVWCDIDPAAFTLDPAALEPSITPRTRAVLPVHLYGVPADMDPILEIARRHDLAVVEDAALATGASYRGRRVGGLGTVAAFSTAPGKVLGGVCSGGVITTDNDELFARLSSLRHYGRAAPADGRSEEGEVPWPSETLEIGYNERLNTLDAAVLLIRLRRLDEDLRKRRANAARYRAHFADSDVRCQAVPPDAQPAWRVFTVRVPNRDRVYEELRRLGYEVTLPYLPPNHLDACYRHLGLSRGSLPETEAFCDELLALPCHQYVAAEDVDELAQRLLALL